MINKYKFPELDTSYWLLKDKAWMQKRIKEWEAIELMLFYKKPKKGRTAIKNYFLKGKLPDWDKLRHWNSYERHLDLFMFLWLHPSSDREVLLKLRDNYITSVVIRLEDIDRGYGVLTGELITMASQEYTVEEKEGLKYLILTEGKGELLFDVMISKFDSTEKELEFLYLDDSPPEKRIFKTPIDNPKSIYKMGRWLCISNFTSINKEFLYQYDQPLEWWYHGLSQNEAYFDKEAQSEAVRRNFREALYRIYHFDTQKEGDTCRTRFVHKIRKILDEREFITEFKQMWIDVKSGKTTIKDPWKL